MINLCLVVIATQFSETKQREHQLMQEQRAQCLSSSTLASLHEPGDCYEELFQLVCHILRKARRRSVALYNQLRGRPLPPPPTRGRGRGGGRGGGSANGGERHHLRQPRRKWEAVGGRMRERVFVKCLNLNFNMILASFTLFRASQCDESCLISRLLNLFGAIKRWLTWI
jgi:hypothetical protein